MRYITWTIYNINTREIVYHSYSHKKASEKLAALGQEYDMSCRWYSI